MLMLAIEVVMVARTYFVYVSFALVAPSSEVHRDLRARRHRGQACPALVAGSRDSLHLQYARSSLARWLCAIDNLDASFWIPAFGVTASCEGFK